MGALCPCTTHSPHLSLTCLLAYTHRTSPLAQHTSSTSLACAQAAGGGTSRSVPRARLSAAATAGLLHAAHAATRTHSVGHETRGARASSACATLISAISSRQPSCHTCAPLFYHYTVSWHLHLIAPRLLLSHRACRSALSLHIARHAATPILCLLSLLL